MYNYWYVHVHIVTMPFILILCVMQEKGVNCMPPPSHDHVRPLSTLPLT